MLNPEDFSNDSGNKVDALADQLRRIAHERGPDGKMPTTREIRDALGVGMATLDNALSELETQGVIYRKHGVGIFVSPRLNRKNVAVLLDPVYFLAPGASPFWAMLWGYLAREAQRRTEDRDEDYVFSLVNVGRGSDEPPFPEMLARGVEEGRVHAVMGVGVSTAAADWLRRRGVPLIAFAGHGPYMVELDGRAMVRAGVDALAAQGCRHIGLWRPVTAFRPVALEWMVHPEEIGAFSEALTAHGLPMDPQLVRQYLELIPQGGGETTLTHPEQGFRLAMEVFGPDAERPRPDGIVCTDDMMMSGVLAALGRLGVKVGGDVKIATHANRGSHVLFGYEDLVTLVETQPEEIVGAMFDHLERALSADDAPAVRGPELRTTLGYRLRSPGSP